VLERKLKQLFGHYSVWEYSVVKIILSLLTFGLICITWVFFRASSFTQAINIVSAMFYISYGQTITILSKEALVTSLAVVFCILVIHWFLRNKTLEEIAEKTPWWCTSIILAFMLYAIATVQGEDRSFIYFQF
jgi:D-alanyl-lipoteichoic acid acyltransferase DltB (MBOAT superfamily)